MMEKKRKGMGWIVLDVFLVLLIVLEVWLLFRPGGKWNPSGEAQIEVMDETPLDPQADIQAAGEEM